MEGHELSRLYVMHPCERSLPGIGMWIVELQTFLASQTDWQGWHLECCAHSLDNGFPINARYSKIISAIGPVLVLQPVQAGPFGALRERLQPRTVVVAAWVSSPEDIWQALSDLRAKHEAGEPLLPAKYVTAMHIMWKLNRERKWGGNAKSYMWSTDLPKGRGMPAELADYVLEVASDLLQAGLLGFKRSKTGVKYCLNPSWQKAIYDIMDNPRFPDSRLPKSVRKGTEQVSARLLDEGVRMRASDRESNPTARERLEESCPNDD